MAWGMAGDRTGRGIANFKQVLKDLMAVGNDVFTGSAWRLPSMVFDKIDFSGI